MKCTSILLGLVVCHMTSFSQVGIGTTTPNSQSILDLSSTASGLLIPRMTSVQKLGLALTAEDAGMVIFQTDIAGPPLITPKGLYTFDGSSWVAPVGNGSSNGQTIRWDGNKWIATTNLFNQGSSIGIGTTSPHGQLHIHSSSPDTKIQISNGTNLAGAGNGIAMGVNSLNVSGYLFTLESAPLLFGTSNSERMRIDAGGNVGINKTNPTATLDVNGSAKVTSLNVNGPLTVTNGSPGAGNGLALGVNLGYSFSYLFNLDNKPLLLGTGNNERMRIDSAGNVGINKTNPTATLDVNGNTKLTSLNVSGPLTANGPLTASGTLTASQTLTANGPLIANGSLTVGVTGTPLNGIIRYSAMIDIPSMISDTDFIYQIEIPNVTTNATVLISPSQALEGIIIGYARVSAPGWVEIKFMNMAHDAEDPDELMFYITVFQ